MERAPSEALANLVIGAHVSQAVHVAASLGFADLLAQGPRTSAELASSVDAHPAALYRLLRALASVGVVEEDDDKRFALTPVGELLRSDVPGSLHGWAVLVGRGYYRDAWSALEHSIRTGENAFRQVHGTDLWSYRAEHPDEREIFDRAMESLTAASHEALLEAFDFGRFGTIVDVGGGNGTLLAGLLTAHPALRGIAFDQPDVVAGAESTLEAAGVAGRCTVVGGSFFDAVPAGGDAYVLKSILHDWEDEEAARILRVCRSAMGEKARLLLVERVLGEPVESSRAAFSDLTMLVLPGGRERALDEWEALIEFAGFHLVGVTPTRAGLSVVEGAPA